MSNSPEPCQTNFFNEEHVALLLESYRLLLNRNLIEPILGISPARQIFEADFALVSHNTDPDPLFNYANRTALALFEFSWAEFVGMPSRFSAEPVNRQERDRLLAEVTARGYIDDYSGIRIAKTGKRFEIKHAVVWNVFDKQANYYGQAACFRNWSLMT